MNARKFVIMVMAAIAAFVLLVYLINHLLSSFPGGRLERSITIAGNLSMVLTMLGLIHQFSGYNQAIKNQENSNFVAMTARFDDLQKLFLEHPQLEGLFSELYGSPQGLANQACPLSIEELAVCSMAFQLMEDVVTMHNLTPGSCPEQCEGWLNLFRRWLKSPRIRLAWVTFGPYFGRPFRSYVTKILENSQ